MPETPELVMVAIPASALIEAVKERAVRGVLPRIAYVGGLAVSEGRERR